MKTLVLLELFKFVMRSEKPHTQIQKFYYPDFDTILQRK